MAICPYCKSEVPDNNKFCTNCGAELKMQPPTQVISDEKADEPEMNSAGDLQDQNAGPSSGSGTGDVHIPQPQTSYNQKIEPIPIGGYIAWAIFNILFCTIPGAIGLYYVLKINKATTYDEQQQTLSTAKKVLIVGTVLGVLNLVGQIGANLS